MAVIENDCFVVIDDGFLEANDSLRRVAIFQYVDAFEMIEICNSMAITVFKKKARNHSWHGRLDIKNLNDFMKKIDMPWPEGIARFEDLKSRVDLSRLPKPKLVRRSNKWSEFSGNGIDVDRWMTGEPYFRSIAKSKTDGPRVIRIAIDLCASAYRSASEISWRSVVGLILSEALENAGYRVEITCYAISRKTYFRSSDSVPSITFVGFTLKKASEPIDLISLINKTSAWFYRIALLSSYYAQKRFEVTDSLGCPILSDESRKILDFVDPPNTFLVEDCWDSQSAVAKIDSILSEIVNKERSI